ncbi:MAG: cytochrome c [Vicinamibacteria bacterium]
MAVAAALAGAVPGGRGASAPPRDALQEAFRDDGLTAAAAQGKALFAARCATCHGPEGRGDGQNAYNLSPAPPDFAESLARVPPADRRRIVESGTAALGRSPQCPPNGRALRDDEVDALVSWLAVAARPAAAPTDEPAPRSWRPRKRSP